MEQITLHELGWDTHFDQLVEQEAFHTSFAARVCAHHGSHILFLTENGEISVPTAIVEVDNDLGEGVSSIAVGDWFLLDRVNQRSHRRLERKTSLSRKAAGETVKSQLIAANIDTVFVVTSCNLDFNLSRIERYLALILDSDAQPVVVLTKADLHDDPAELRQLAEALHPGLIVESLDARESAEAECLRSWCGVGKTVALLGSSGVGKSTLANALAGTDIRTANIRGGDDKGRHTTTARSMHRLGAGGWLIDNPGMRELQLPECEQGVAELFDDVIALTAQCKFGDCSHNGDAGCALESAVANGELDQRRVTNYLKLQSEQARNSASLAERRAMSRKFGKECKQIMAGKKKRKYDN